jgi:hypothetical protein
MIKILTISIKTITASNKSGVLVCTATVTTSAVLVIAELEGALDSPEEEAELAAVADEGGCVRLGAGVGDETAGACVSGDDNEGDGEVVLLLLSSGGQELNGFMVLWLELDGGGEAVVPCPEAVGFEVVRLGDVGPI